METTEITFNIDHSRKLFQKYFKYERKQELNRIPSRWIFIICLVLTFIGIYFSNGILIYFSLGMVLLLAIVLIIYRIKFQLFANKYQKELERKAKSKENSYRFSFNENEIIYESENTLQKLKWNIIKGYHENQGDIYLYLDHRHRHLFDIISMSIIGREKYEKFKSILSQKTN